MSKHSVSLTLALLVAILLGGLSVSPALAATDESLNRLPANWQFISDTDERNRLAAEQPHLLDTVVNRNANLRAGPGTNYAIIGNQRAGQDILIIGQNPAGDWLQVEPGDRWIARFLVDGAEGITWPVATYSVSEQATPPLTALPAGQAAQVVNIVDGDTIDVSINGQQYRLRYILMDTPERGQPYFTEATEANRRLVAGKTVYLVKDVSETDRYGRLLRYVYLEDGTFVNRELVRLGYAQIATFPPDVSKADEIRAAQAEAQAQGRGLWEGSGEQGASDVSGPGTTATNRTANIRSGPGTNYSILRTVPAGTRLSITGQNPAGDWLQIDSGSSWIARFLVAGAQGVTWPTVFTPIVTPPADTPVCDCSYNRYNCSDFSTHAQAQACFRYCIVQGRGDVHRLDGDNDGLACEALP